MKKVSKKKTSKKKVTRNRIPTNLANEINRRFDFVNNLTPEQTENCVRVRRTAKQLTRTIVLNTPVCREQSLAITKLEEALHFAIAAIVRPEKETING